jgi:hypothetical protein
MVFGRVAGLLRHLAEYNHKMNACFVGQEEPNLLEKQWQCQCITRFAIDF